MVLNGSTVTVQEKNDTVTVKRHRGPGAWSRNEEKELVNLFRKGTSLEALAERYRRNPRAVRAKLERLGLNIAASKLEVSGGLELPKELPSLEEVLKIVAAAIQKACQGGLGKTELQRLDTIATLYKAYAAGLEQYVGYRKIEAELVRMKEKYEQWAKEKTKGLQTKSNSA
jgi:hypothetical protein